MPVIILGMHRSGTSALARCVNLMGPTVGPVEALFSPAPDNPRGFWENVQLTDLNGEILSACGGSSTVPPHLVENWWKAPHLDELKGRCRAALSGLFGNSTNWCWKDPRTCLTLPLWLELIAPRPVIVFIHRHPLEVARSLQKRDALATADSLCLWNVYVCHALANMSGLPVFALGFDDLLSSPMDLLARLTAFLGRHGVEGIAVPDETAVREFLTPELRHWRLNEEADGRSEQIAPDHLELQQVLRSLPQTSDAFVPPAWPDRLALVDSLLRLTRAAYELEAKTRADSVGWLEGQRAAWEQQAIGAEALVSEVRAELSAKSGELAALQGIRDACQNLRTEVDGLRAELARSAGEAEQARAREDNLAQIVTARAREMASLRAVLEERQTELSARQAELQNLERMLAEIESSRAWWWLSLWRRLRHGLFRNPRACLSGLLRGDVRIRHQLGAGGKGDTQSAHGAPHVNTVPAKATDDAARNMAR